MPTKKTVKDLFAAVGGAEPEPCLDARLDPPDTPEPDPGPQATPLRARPQHPHWLGKPITESAIRSVHLWPRTKPAPAAVVSAAKIWGKILKASKAAWRDATARPEAAAVDVMCFCMADAYRRQGCGVAPPRELLRDEDHPDLAPTDKKRIEFDVAVLLIAKAQVAINQAYEKGGAWRAAVEDI